MNELLNVAAWVRETFGEASAENAPERTLRAVEEVVELAQALDVDPATLHRLIDYVYSRPVGNVGQEIAGSLVTIFAAAAALEVDVDEVFAAEMDRIHTPEVIERCRRRQHEKREALAQGQTPSEDIDRRQRLTWGALLASFGEDIDREKANKALTEGALVGASFVSAFQIRMLLRAAVVPLRTYYIVESGWIDEVGAWDDLTANGFAIRGARGTNGYQIFNISPRGVRFLEEAVGLRKGRQSW